MLVNLVDGRSPHILCITKDSKTDPPKTLTAIIAANTAANTVNPSSGKMFKKSKAKRLAAMLAAQNAKQAARQVSAQAFMARAPQGTYQAAGQATVEGVAQTTVQVVAQTTMQGAAQATVQAVAQVSGNASYLSPNTNQQTSGTDTTPHRIYTKRQKKKWNKILRKKAAEGVINTNLITPKAAPGNEPVINEEAALLETSQDGSPNVTGQASGAATAASVSTVTTELANQGPTVPIIQKPSITLKTKKNLQQEMVSQQLNWTRPDGNAAGNVPGTSAAPQTANLSVSRSPLIVEVPLSAGLIPGSTIPILENRTVDSTSRINAGSFFKKSAPPQPPPSPMVPVEPHTVPIIQKPSITLKTKKNLQQEMVSQQLNWTRPDGNGAGNVPGTSAAPQTANQSVSRKGSPLTVEVPLSAGLIPGSTIPILENRTVESTSRINAGSFFKKSAPPQPTPSTMVPVETYVYRYPKGIPRSFLLQQEKSLEPSGSPITADSPIWPSNPNMNAYQMNPQLFDRTSPTNVGGTNTNPAISPIFVQPENPVDVEQPYSPSDVYSEQGTNPEPPELDSESCEQTQAGQKRLSAFQRLGPVSQPKKTKLTINLNLKKEQPVREVVNETDDDPDKYTPVHLRKDIIMSTDETVVKFLPFWPWRKNVTIRKSATARNSRSVMILEQEKMEEQYEKDNVYVQISVKGYPSTWTKERVLDTVLDSVRGYSLIPCFTEFYQHECKFLVIRSRSALVVLHKTGFYIHKDGVELAITIAIPVLPDQPHFIPRLIVRKRIVMGYMDKKLNLSAFTLQDDISHFVYFPLNRVSNQSECLLLQTAIEWDRLVELDLSHNRLTNISGFDLVNTTPSLKHLDLSHNCLEKITVLLKDRQLPLKTIRLEGNPLCHDYIDPEHYVKVIRMMFPAVVEIDGVPIHRKGELLNHKQNYCPEEAREVTEKFLEIFFPLMDSGPDHRSLIQGMYEDDATLTITYCYKLRYGQLYRNFRNLFLYARFLDEGETDSVVGAMAITKLINRWPHTEHDRFTFTVDALYHNEHTTVLRISGVLKLTTNTLAEDEHLLSFTRTVVLHSEDGTEYKIQNEMVYWHEPSVAAARSAFRVNTISQKNFNLKIESTTDEDLRDKFLKIFMKLTTMDKTISERCLEINNWNFKLALEHFTKLLKLNNLDSLTQEVQAAS